MMAIKNGTFETTDGREYDEDYVECDGCGDYALENMDIRDVDPDIEHLCPKCEAKRCPRCRRYSQDFPNLCDPCLDADDREESMRDTAVISCS